MQAIPTETEGSDPAPHPTVKGKAGAQTRFRLGTDPRALASDRRRIEQDLRQALTARTLTLHFQPRYSLADRQCFGAEALLRWPHRKRGLIAPAVFLPIAERSELIVPLGGWVLSQACRIAAHWPVPAGALGSIVSVNIAARQLRGAALLGQIAEALEASGLDAERLELEFTESMLVDGDADTLLALSAIRDLGIGIALDDFGTGYASLSMLKRLPLTALKLDRSLIRDLPADEEDAAIVRAVVQTAHVMGMAVAAEGIETEGQCRFLASVGCDQGQGFLFNPALPAEQVSRVLHGG